MYLGRNHRQLTLRQGSRREAVSCQKKNLTSFCTLDIWNYFRYMSNTVPFSKWHFFIRHGWYYQSHKFLRIFFLGRFSCNIPCVWLWVCLCHHRKPKPQSPDFWLKSVSLILAYLKTFLVFVVSIFFLRIEIFPWSCSLQTSLLCIMG